MKPERERPKLPAKRGPRSDTIVDNLADNVNPFSARITIFGMNIRADYSAVVDSDLQVGTVIDRSRIVIPPHEEMLTSYVDVTLSAKLSTMVSLLGPLLAGSFGLSLSGFINVTIGDQFELTRLPITLLNISSTQEASR